MYYPFFDGMDDSHEQVKDLRWVRFGIPMCASPGFTHPDQGMEGWIGKRPPSI
jgi:hypothetical protein